MAVKVSVIMCVYNPYRLFYVERAIESIRKQTYTDWELLLFNDKSGDKETIWIKNFSRMDRRIRYIEGEENRGNAYGLNVCIQKAKGKYIARMDADDISMPSRLEKQVAFLEQFRQYDYVGTGAWLFNEKGIWGQRNMKQNPVKEDFLAFSPYIHPSVMFRKEVFSKYGLYNTSKKMRRCEDYELFIRLYKKGSLGYNLQDNLIGYREGYENYKNRKILYRIYEMLLRQEGFKSLGLRGIKAWIFQYRPLASGILPVFLLAFLKRISSDVDKIHGEKQMKYFENERCEYEKGKYENITGSLR